MTILIAAPIGGKKQYSMGLWLEWIANQTHQDYEVALCTNGDQRWELKKKLEQTSWVDMHGNHKKPIVLLLAHSAPLTPIQRITYAREKLRRYAVEHGYEGVFWLDTDTIPLDITTLSKLVKHDKESVSAVYFYKGGSQPVIIDKDTHTNIALHKLEEFATKKELIPIWGGGYGCVLHCKRALETPFDYALFGESYTDDFGHCHALEQQGIQRWLDPSLLCRHYGITDFEKLMDGIGGNNG